MYVLSGLIYCTVYFRETTVLLLMMILKICMLLNFICNTNLGFYLFMHAQIVSLLRFQSVHAYNIDCYFNFCGFVNFSLFSTLCMHGLLLQFLFIDIHI